MNREFLGISMALFFTAACLGVFVMYEASSLY